jgi:NAD(P)-dependent dehydrogenase (short-subunit alcohol dehydrogenase family)
MNRVQNKIAVVTGGALGIGKSACELLAKEGAKVAVTDILVKEGEQTVSAINARGGTAKFWHLDVSNEREVETVFADVAKTFGSVDVLVNNAGISGVSKPTDQITEAEWDKVMAVNVKGVLFCTKHAIAYMKRAGKGSIINLSSIYGIVGALDVPPYHASKGAVRLMTKTDALYYAQNQIRVNSVHPGFIWTPMVESFVKSQGDVEAGKKALASLHPIGFVGEPDDIGWCIVYLASDESRFVTGAEFIIDGGYTAR